MWSVMHEKEEETEVDNSVLFTQDLWSSIVEFCDHRTLFGSLSRLSQWHLRWMDDPQNNRVIRAVICSSDPLILSPHNPSIQECSGLWNGIIDSIFLWIRDHRDRMPPGLMSPLMYQLTHSPDSNESHAIEMREIHNLIHEVQLKILTITDSDINELGRRIEEGTITYDAIFRHPNIVPFLLQIIRDPPLFEPHSEVIPLHVPRKFDSVEHDYRSYLKHDMKISSVDILTKMLSRISDSAAASMTESMTTLMIDSLLSCLRMSRNSLLCDRCLSCFAQIIFENRSVRHKLVIPGLLDYLLVNRMELVDTSQWTIVKFFRFLAIMDDELPLPTLERTLRIIVNQFQITVDEPEMLDALLCVFKGVLGFNGYYISPNRNENISEVIRMLANEMGLFSILNDIIHESFHMEEEHQISIQESLFAIFDGILRIEVFNADELMDEVLALNDLITRSLYNSEENPQRHGACLVLSSLLRQSKEQTRAFFDDPRLLNTIVDFAKEKSHFSHSAGLLLRSSIDHANASHLRQLLDAGFIRAMVCLIDSRRTFYNPRMEREVVHFLQSLEKAVIQGELPSSVLDEAKQECIEMGIHDVMDRMDMENSSVGSEFRRNINDPEPSALPCSFL